MLCAKGVGGSVELRGGIGPDERTLRFKPGDTVLFHTSGTDWYRKGVVVGPAKETAVWGLYEVHLEDGAYVQGYEDQMRSCEE